MSHRMNDEQEEGVNGDEYTMDVSGQTGNKTRKRSMALCKNCNQLGHYQKTCPLLAINSSTNPTDNDGNPLSMSENQETLSVPKHKKSKHPKFMSNQGSLPLQGYSEGTTSAYVPMNSENADYSSDEDAIQINHNSSTQHSNELRRDHELMGMDKSDVMWGHQATTGGSSMDQTVHLHNLTSLGIDSDKAIANRRWGSWKNDIRRFVGSHFPVRVQDEKLEDGKVKDKRHRCKWATCKKKSKFKCTSCDVFLCIGTDDTNNCFFQFHTIPHGDHAGGGK